LRNKGTSQAIACTLNLTNLKSCAIIYLQKRQWNRVAESHRPESLETVEAGCDELGENPSGAANPKWPWPPVGLDGIAARYHSGGMSTYLIEWAFCAN
jgi:hypothetical protein